MTVTKFNTESKKILQEGLAENIVEVDTGEGAIERFLAKMKSQRNYPPAHFAYHAYGNQRGKWTVEAVKIILNHALSNGLEVRAWSNEESAINLICVKDPDMSENSGFDLYTKMHGKYDSYGLASWYEFDKWGIPINMFGDIKIGKSGSSVLIEVKPNEWVILD
jgi:hypothetical protein